MDTSKIREHGTPRFVAALAWTGAALSVVPLVLMLISPLLGVEEAADDVPWFADIGILAAFLGFAAVGALIVSRRPSNTIGWIFLAFGLSSQVAVAAESFSGEALARSTDAVLPRLGAWASNTIGGPVSIIFLIALLFLFPDGRAASPRWRNAGRVAALACAGYVLLWSFVPGPLQNTAVDVPVINPLGIEALRPLRALLDPLFVILPALLIAGAVSLVMRFRRSRGAQRQQIKWLALSGVLIAIAFVLGPAVFWHPFAPDFAWPLTFAVVILSVPIACGMAILRYRLYDIDRIISRTVSYAIVTAILGGMFALVVLLPVLLGVDEAPDYVIAAATLVVAALFRPVRRRVQAVVDRRFNRARVDAARTIEAFAGRLREQIDLDTLAVELEALVDRTMHPAHLFLWVREEGRR